MYKLKIKPCIIWFTGLSGSGKSKISQAVRTQLEKLGVKKVKLIDGDIFRKKIKNFSYSQSGRNKVGNAKLILAKSFKKKGYVVLVSGIAANKSWRKKIKKTTKELIEVYVKCPLYICKKRDYKNIYRLSNNFQKYQEGNTRDIIVKSNLISKTKAVQKVVSFLKMKNNF